jgi:hypothetical protein
MISGPPCMLRSHLQDSGKRMTNQQDKVWRKKSAAMREQFAMTQDCKPWTQMAGVQLTGVGQCQRAHDLIDICWEARRNQIGHAQGVEAAKHSLWADISQAVQRLPFRQFVPCLCQTTVPYSYSRDTVLSGHDALALMGVPDAHHAAPAHEFSQAELRGLAGEAFFLPTAMSVVLPYYLNPHAPWWGS